MNIFRKSFTFTGSEIWLLNLNSTLGDGAHQVLLCIARSEWNKVWVLLYKVSRILYCCFFNQWISYILLWRTWLYYYFSSFGKMPGTNQPRRCSYQGHVSSIITFLALHYSFTSLQKLHAISVPYVFLFESAPAPSIFSHAPVDRIAHNNYIW